MKERRIDWVQDATKAQLQRRIVRRRKEGFFGRGGGTRGWRRKLWESYDAGQAWIVITIIGEILRFSRDKYEEEGMGWLTEYRCGYRNECILLEYCH